jgi:hypothetical protein
LRVPKTLVRVDDVTKSPKLEGVERMEGAVTAAIRVEVGSDPESARMPTGARG